MKTLKKTLSVLLSMAAILNLTACQNGAAEENQSPKSLVARAETMTPMEFAAAMQPGWNLGNTLDASSGETSWGNPKTTPELIKKSRRRALIPFAYP